MRVDVWKLQQLEVFRYYFLTTFLLFFPYFFHFFLHLFRLGGNSRFAEFLAANDLVGRGPDKYESGTTLLDTNVDSY